MSSHQVTQLGTLGIEVSDVPGWERFATQVLGLEIGGSDPDGTLFLRMDQNHHRIALHPGARDDLAYAGWEAQDEASLRGTRPTGPSVRRAPSVASRPASSAWAISC